MCLSQSSPLRTLIHSKIPSRARAEIGVGLTSFGALFMMLGVMLFFDGALLALGNVRSSFHHSSPAPNVYSRPSPPAQRMQILFLGGLFLIIGPQKTFYFFARRNKLRGTACFLGGILLVFFKWPTIGVLVEMFGFLNLFGCVGCYYSYPRDRTHATQNCCPSLSLSFQRFLPCYHYLPPPITLHRPVPQSAVCSPCTLGSPLTHARSLMPVCASARRPFCRLAYLCSMTTRVTPVYWRFVLLDRAVTIIDATGMPLNISQKKHSIKYMQITPSLPLRHSPSHLCDSVEFKSLIRY